MKGDALHDNIRSNTMLASIIPTRGELVAEEDM